jgi:hypothetical protein
MNKIVTHYAVLGGGALLMFLGGLLLAFRPTGGIGIPQRLPSYQPMGALSVSPASEVFFVVGLVLLVLGFAAVVGWTGFEIGRTLRADATALTAPAARRKS